MSNNLEIIPESLFEQRERQQESPEINPGFVLSI